MALTEGMLLPSGPGGMMPRSTDKAACVVRNTRECADQKEGSTVAAEMRSLPRREGRELQVEKGGTE